MKNIALQIERGAMAFLRSEYTVLAGFIALVPIGLFILNRTEPTSDPLVAMSFVFGACASGLAGFFGMRVATKANVRTAAAARTGLAPALQIAFRGGAVMGMSVVGLALLGLGSLFWFYIGQFHVDVTALDQQVQSFRFSKVINVLAGFSMGASSIALFARVGGGIYTKAADVGADLVGKVEAGIPEDDVRNPATIADNVGDNVGDVAGMGADLFGSFVATILATMVLGQEIKSADNFGGMAPILLPMLIAGLGIIFSIIGTFFVRIKNETSNVQNALNLGNWSSIILTGIGSYFAVMYLLPDTLSI